MRSQPNKKLVWDRFAAPQLEVRTFDRVIMEIARYIQLPQFISLLSSGLFIPKTSLFEDELEGLTSLMNSYYADVGVAPKMENDWAKEWIYTSCWYKSTGESVAMWKLYGSNSESIMIKTTTNKLKKILLNSKKHNNYPARLNFVSYVNYFEYPRTIYEKSCSPRASTECSHLYNHKLDDFFRKHPAYRHEQEIRLCVIEKNAVEPYEKNKNPGISIPIDNDFISAVVFAPNATPWFKDVVKEILKKYQLKVMTFDSELEWHKEIFSPRAIMF